MTQGDKDLAAMKPMSDQLVKQISNTFQGVFAGGKVDGAAFVKSAQNIKLTTAKMTKAAAAAKAQYAEVDTLKSVPFYKEYADDRIKSIELAQQQPDSLNAFLDKWSAAMSQSNFDPVAFVAASRDLSVQMDATSTAIAKLEAQAAALKKSKNL